MAKKKTSGKKHNMSAIAPKQIAIMRTLAPGAIAWLLDIDQRTIRDHAELPRTVEGFISARTAVEWNHNRVKVPAISDGDLEKLWRAAHASSAAHAANDARHAITTALKHAVEKYGETALVTFARLFLADLLEDFDFDETQPPDIRSNSYPLEPELQKDDIAFAELRAAVQCPECNRIRYGRTWRKRPARGDRVTSIGHCPDCRVY